MHAGTKYTQNNKVNEDVNEIVVCRVVWQQLRIADTVGVLHTMPTVSSAGVCKGSWGSREISAAVNHSLCAISQGMCVLWRNVEPSLPSGPTSGNMLPHTQRVRVVVFVEYVCG